MELIFSPASKQNVHIQEYDLNEIFNQFSSKDIELKTFVVDGKDYIVNLSSSRYRLFQKNRTCVCCGLIGNRVFLDHDEQNNGYHFNLYAENKEKDSEKTYLTLMTRDHIIAKSAGGSEEDNNLQTLCVHCNQFKAQGFAIEQIRSCLFTAHRIFKSTYALSQTKKKLLPLQQKLDRCLNGIENIKAAFPLIPKNKLNDLEEKISNLIQEKELLTNEILKISLEAQTTGIIPEST